MACAKAMVRVVVVLATCSPCGSDSRVADCVTKTSPIVTSGAEMPRGSRKGAGQAPLNSPTSLHESAIGGQARPHQRCGSICGCLARRSYSAAEVLRPSNHVPPPSSPCRAAGSGHALARRPCLRRWCSSAHSLARVAWHARRSPASATPARPASTVRRDRTACASAPRAPPTAAEDGASLCPVHRAKRVKRAPAMPSVGAGRAAATSVSPAAPTAPPQTSHHRSSWEHPSAVKP